MKTPKPLTRSPCAIANALDIVGDKWTLLVVRDLLLGKSTYGQLVNSPEHIPTNILADRLKHLQATGIILSRAYQQRPVRHAYTLTPKGLALDGVLNAVVRWAKHHIPGTVALSAEAANAATSGARGRSVRGGLRLRGRK